jgi:lipoate-protein ligase A
MAVDRAILVACEAGKVPPTLRLYGWGRPTLSVGYAQDLSKEIETGRCRELNIPVVRRPTGGRALLHYQEVTYSLIAPIPHPEFPSSLLGTYRKIAQALLVGLRQVGVRDAALAPVRRHSRTGDSFRSPSCLASLNHGEIEVHGAKLVGSAQRRTNRAFLQHGSILIRCDRTLMHSLLKFSHANSRSNSFETLKQKVTTLSECLGREISFKEVAQAMLEGFRQTFQGEWVCGHLTPFEQKYCVSRGQVNRVATAP